MRLEEPMAGAEASEAEATTGLGEDTAVAEDEMEQATPAPHPHADAATIVQTASSEPQPPQVGVLDIQPSVDNISSSLIGCCKFAIDSYLFN